MEKLERDGMVGVVYSPGYGGGWSTWNEDKDREVLCMDRDIVQAVLDGDNRKAWEIACQKCGRVSDVGVEELKVEWVDKGSQFEISEYDGSESIRAIGPSSYMTA